MGRPRPIREIILFQRKSFLCECSARNKGAAAAAVPKHKRGRNEKKSEINKKRSKISQPFCCCFQKQPCFFQETEGKVEKTISCMIIMHKALGSAGIIFDCI